MRRSELLQELKPFFLRWLQQGADAGLTVGEGPGIDLVGATVGLGGDAVLLYHADGSPVAECATIAAALAAATSGDMVEPQAKTYSENITLPAGVTLIGRGPATVIAGTVTGGAGATMRSVRVVIDGDDAGFLYGVAGPTSGTFTVEDCEILVDNATGDAAALYTEDAGEIVARRCLLRGKSVGGNGWAAYVDGGGGGDLVHCTYQCNDKTHPLYDASEEA